MGENTTNSNNLTVLKGGLAETFESSRKVFDSAYVTNTRLMGVIGLGIVWKLPDNQLLDEMHQFFYLDAEEYGLDTYTCLLGGTEEDIESTENELIGGLGADKIEISLREAMYIVQQYAKFNRKHHFPVPDAAPDFQYIMKEKILLSDAELNALMQKQCIHPKSEYETINYFLMRLFGKDTNAAKFLLAEEISLDVFPELKQSTLIVNTIDEDEAANSYICESLIEFDDTYHIIITHIQTENLRVKNISRVSEFQITPAEAAMMVCKPEYVTEYLPLSTADEIDFSKLPILHKAVVTEHDKGKLYMIFHDSNSHVNQKVYRLNDDVDGILFVSDEGPVLSAAYSHSQIDKIDQSLSGTEFEGKLLLLAKYEFKEPIIFDFIQSDFDDFELFVETYGEEE